MTFPYPGDDLSALMSLNEAMSSAYTELNNLTADVTQSQSQLSSAWTGDAADMATADIGTLTAALAEHGQADERRRYCGAELREHPERHPDPDR